MAALKKFSIAISQDDMNGLDKLALTEDRSRNWLINQAIKEFLEKKLGINKKHTI